ncbi:hypothetical protein CFP56_023325 [Quercus suber]|uniref:Uncharacterized protein n=1 Tax=Quercus suber TaxID=58331 RepID=A0AAW0K8V8_QUESU
MARSRDNVVPEYALLFFLSTDVAEHVKDGSENLVQQTQQLQGIQSQLQSLQHNSLRIAHQVAGSNL